MPRLTHGLPKLRHHKTSGQALVVLGGVLFYLGPYGSAKSKTEYDRVVKEWLQAGRPTRYWKQAPELTITELVRDYRRDAKRHYVKNGVQTSEVALIKQALKHLLKLYRHTPAAKFGPIALKAVRQAMIDADLSRPVINRHVGRIRRMFKWGVENELVDESVWRRLQAVRGLQKGRTTAREPAPIKPVADELIEKTLPHLSAIVADMVRFQRLTGARPAEVCAMRPCDIDRSQDVWEFNFGLHKTVHHDKERIVFIGPKAQAVILPYLLRDAEAFCFSPIDAEKARREKQRDERKTPVQPSQRNRRKRKPAKSPGDHYTTSSYRRAIHNACDDADELAKPEVTNAAAQAQCRIIPRWSPNRLRHSAATEIRKRYGLEGAQVALGHSSADVTQIYAERDMQLAAKIAREVG